jgi:hypothetical protein
VPSTTWSSPSSDVDGRVMAMLRRALPPPPPATVNGSAGDESVKGHTHHAHRDTYAPHTQNTHTNAYVYVFVATAWHGGIETHALPFPPSSCLCLPLTVAGVAAVVAEARLGERVGGHEEALTRRALVEPAALRAALTSRGHTGEASG